jgi:hypothetical protein
VISWVRTTWESINADIVEKALRASYLHPDMDLSETAIWKHERLGEMFHQQKILDQEDAGTDDSDKEGNADEEIEEESDIEDAICVLDKD